MRACTIDGVPRRAEEATISVMGHGLLYGDGVFEGLRFYAHRSFRVDQHLDRLRDSAIAIGLELPMSKADMKQAIERTIKASGLSDGYIRLVVTRGEGSLGLDPASCIQARTIIIADELAMVSPESRQRGVNVIIASTRRLNADQLDPRVKTLNYLNQISAKQEASAAGADEAILLNQAGRVAEGTADNIFIVKNSHLLTPPTSEGPLDGITRSVIIEIAAGLGIVCEQALLSVYDLYTADECFLTGTGAELIPVASVAGRQLPPKRDIFRRLETAFAQLIHDNRIEPAIDL